MEGIELLKYWKKSVDNAIVQTWKAFNEDKQLFLTESDIKCYLYNELRQARPSQAYAVHSEVTHYANHQNPHVYRFRDISLMNPSKIDHNNMELIYAEAGLDNQNLQIRHKGFRHIGEAIFIEIKLQRNNNDRINEGDFDNLKTYHNDVVNTPKFAVLIWASKHTFTEQNNLKDQMIIALQGFSNHNGNELKMHNDQVFGYVFNHEELHKIEWIGDTWV
jgi:hypothetical protein